MGKHKDIINLTDSDVREARTYIERFWVNLERYQPSDADTIIGLPNPYLVPAHDPLSSFNFDEMYYWDSYFVIQGMLKKPESKDLVLGILENLFTLLKRFKIIPNASRTYLMGRSQPPLLTSFIFDVYEAYALDRRWLEQAISYAKLEYETVWMGQEKPHWRQVHQGLSRYYDINMLHDLAEAESGWDMTPRFSRKCLNFLPVDLNAFLYKYETDFARAASILELPEDEADWKKKAETRKHTMTELMWSEGKRFFFDYNFVKKEKSKIFSLAGFMPLWAGMLDKHQAEKIVKNLELFESTGGLSTTKPTKKFGEKTPEQWAHPNGWAPLHFLVVEALKKYGFNEEADQIAKKWLKTNLDWFNDKGMFLEKYNVAEPSKEPVTGVYPLQTGFGWTNAVFERFCQDFIDEKAGKE